MEIKSGSSRPDQDNKIFRNQNRAQAICRAKVESHNPGIFSRLEKEEQKTLLSNGGWWTGGEKEEQNFANIW